MATSSLACNPKDISSTSKRDPRVTSNERNPYVRLNRSHSPWLTFSAVHASSATLRRAYTSLIITWALCLGEISERLAQKLHSFLIASNRNSITTVVKARKHCEYSQYHRPSALCRCRENSRTRKNLSSSSFFEARVYSRYSVKSSCVTSHCVRSLPVGTRTCLRSSTLIRQCAAGTDVVSGAHA